MTTDCDASVWCEVRLTGSDKLLVGCVYRSPNSNRENDVKINTTLQKANSSLTDSIMTQDTVMYFLW